MNTISKTRPVLAMMIVLLPVFYSAQTAIPAPWKVVLDTIVSLVLLFEGMSVALFPSYYDGALTRLQTIQSPLIALPLAVRCILNSIGGRLMLAAYLWVMALISCGAALLELAGTIMHGGLINWISCFLYFPIAACFALAVVLQPAADLESAQHNVLEAGPSLANGNQAASDLGQSSPGATTRYEQDRITSLLRLFASLLFLDGAIYWFITALKDQKFGHWWSFACSLGAFICFASVFLSGQVAQAGKSTRQLTSPTDVSPQSFPRVPMPTVRDTPGRLSQNSSPNGQRFGTW